MDKYTIVKLKKEGLSNRKIAKILHVDRKTINKHWNAYQDEIQLLQDPSSSVSAVQEKIVSPPTYDSSHRTPRKYTLAMDQALDTILAAEEEKQRILQTHKQQFTNIQIHQQLVEQGFDIGITTISNKIRAKRQHAKECFIRQEYNLGDRVEYDFGEVRLVVDQRVRYLYIAVFSAPASQFRWAYLYDNQKKAAFLDSHVQFFAMLQGVYREIVYDNMRNVVTKFIGHNEKELNADLLKMSLYYGFQINVTNCFSGNEKGHVESSVKILRNQVFSHRYRFASLEEAADYLQECCKKHNQDSQIDKEKTLLLPTKPPLELAEIRQVKINRYSFARIENHFYSVPDYLVGQKITAKLYPRRIDLYARDHYVCSHTRGGETIYHVCITHYLPTFQKKPGAIRHSIALKSIPSLHSVFEVYYVSQPRVFLDLVTQHKDKPMHEIVTLLQQAGKEQSNPPTQQTHIVNYTLKQLKQYSILSQREGVS